MGGIWNSGTLTLTDNITVSYNTAIGGESVLTEGGGHAYGVEIIPAVANPFT